MLHNSLLCTDRSTVVGRVTGLWTNNFEKISTRQEHRNDHERVKAMAIMDSSRVRRVSRVVALLLIILK